MLNKIGKLKGRSFAELADRGRQSASVLAERIGASSGIRLLSDAKFFAMFSLGTPVSAESLFAHFRKRNDAAFYRSFDDLDETLAVLAARFPDSVAAIIEQADRICEGRFDLLGYENIFFESMIPNWHFDPISGKTSPMVHWSLIDEIESEQTGDKKTVWELNRHQYFSTLGRAYRITKDEKYARVFVDHIEDWIANNPPKLGLNWLSSLEIAYRSISWLWALQFFKDSPELSPETFTQILKTLYLNGCHIESHLSMYSSPNTHLTGEALGLYFLGTQLPELNDAARWKKLGYGILVYALDVQVLPDGVYCEQSTAYQRYTVDFYAALMILRGNEGLEIDSRLTESLRSMLNFLASISQPDGSTPLIGDDDGGRLHFLDERPFADFRSTLSLGAVLLDDPELKFVAKEPTAELLWLLGADGPRKFDAIEAVPPKETAIAFEAGGYFSIRSSWKSNADFLLIDCGPHGYLKGGHAHADALHFVLSIDGRPVFIDPGTFNYTSAPELREVYRSTAAHNCLTVNGVSSSIPDGPFSWSRAAKANVLEWQNNESGAIVRGTHNGFQHFGVCYEREFKFSSTGDLTLTDVIRSGNSNTYELNFILSPEMRAEIGDDGRVTLLEKQGSEPVLNIDTTLISKKGVGLGEWRIESFAVSPRYGALVDSTKLVFKVQASGDLQICSVFNKVLGH